MVMRPFASPPRPYNNNGWSYHRIQHTYLNSFFLVLKHVRMGIIYKATHIESGMAYIGKSVNLLNKRKLQHLSSARTGQNSCPAFHQAINTYGSEAFVWQVVAEVPDELLFEEESRYIREFGTLFPDGFNLISSMNYNAETGKTEYEHRYDDEGRELPIFMCVERNGYVAQLRTCKGSFTNKNASRQENYEFCLRFMAAKNDAERQLIYEDYDRLIKSARDPDGVYICKYVWYVKNCVSGGYAVRIPSKEYRKFTHSAIDLEEKRKLAMEFADAETDDAREQVYNRYLLMTRKFDGERLPQYVQRVNKDGKQGYGYYEPGVPVFSCVSNKLSMDQKKQLIIAYAFSDPAGRTDIEQRRSFIKKGDVPLISGVTIYQNGYMAKHPEGDTKNMARSSVPDHIKLELACRYRMGATLEERLKVAEEYDKLASILWDDAGNALPPGVKHVHSKKSDSHIYKADIGNGKTKSFTLVYDLDPKQCIDWAERMHKGDANAATEYDRYCLKQEILRSTEGDNKKEVVIDGATYVLPKGISYRDERKTFTVKLTGFPEGKFKIVNGADIAYRAAIDFHKEQILNRL